MEEDKDPTQLAVEHIARGHSRPKPKAVAHSASRDRAEEWARQVGFEERLVPWASATACTMRFMRISPITKESVLAHLRATRPELFQPES